MLKNLGKVFIIRIGEQIETIAKEICEGRPDTCPMAARCTL
jgi:hypothetical protein